MKQVEFMKRFCHQPQIIRPREFTASRSWGAMDIAKIDGVSIKLHWTKKPYQWHTNDGDEVFVVVDGSVEMLFKKEGKEHSVELKTGDIFHVSEGIKHMAIPKGEARILVIERENSI